MSDIDTKRQKALCLLAASRASDVIGEMLRVITGGPRSRSMGLVVDMLADATKYAIEAERMERHLELDGLDEERDKLHAAIVRFQDGRPEWGTG